MHVVPAPLTPHFTERARSMRVRALFDRFLRAPAACIEGLPEREARTHVSAGRANESSKRRAENARGVLDWPDRASN